MEGPEPPVSAWLDAIISYAAYLSQEEDATPDHLRAFVASRREVAASDRQRLNDFRPAPSFHTPGPAAENEPFLDFRQWIVREYQDDLFLRGHELPRRHSQRIWIFMSDISKQTGLNHGSMSFDCSEPMWRTTYSPSLFQLGFKGTVHRPSFHTWFEDDNHYRRSEGESQMTFREGLQNYPIKASLSPEEENDFILARDRHFEENQRRMYGFARRS